MNAPGTPTPDHLTGRVLLVTGAASGIGRAIALTAAQAGARVVVSDHPAGRRSRRRRPFVAAGGEALFVPCDVADVGAVEHLVAAAVEQFGQLDVLVNNAGISGGAELAHELEMDAWDRVMAVNLRGPFLCARAALPHLMAARRGHRQRGLDLRPDRRAPLGGVLRLEGRTDQPDPATGRRLRSPAGAGQRGLSRLHRHRHGRRARPARPRSGQAAAQARREANAARQPLGRQAQAEEVARVVVFLASGRGLVHDRLGGDGGRRLHRHFQSRGLNNRERLPHLFPISRGRSQRA